MLLGNSTSAVSMWHNASTKINCYFSIFLLIFGVVGNILNTLVLSQRTLRANTCAWLFRISSIFNLISILTGLPTRVLSIWMIDVTDEIQWLCQLRVFVLLTSRSVATWLLTLATFDRWLLSCRHVRRRRWSKLKNAKRETMVIVILSSCLYSPIFYCYQANLSNTPLKCYSRNIQCRIYIDQLYLGFTILIPILLMIFFGALTLSNVRRMHCRMRSPLLPRLCRTISKNRRRLRLIDRRLFVMLLVQIGFLALFALPQGIEMVYLTVTRNEGKTSLQRAVENSIFLFTLLLTYSASGMPFYIYTISGGQIFQQALYRLLTRTIRRTACRLS